jgi:alpha-beta hydrolase superfamily lysophospholipase
MQASTAPTQYGRARRPRWLLRSAITALATVLGGAAFDVQQRKWIFLAGSRVDAESVQRAIEPRDVWIDFVSRAAGSSVCLHGHWLEPALPQAPVLLYLHGARCDVASSAARMHRLRDLGFGVLAIDYRGFGRSTAELPSEVSACEDAQAAWQWLAARHASAARYVYGHSLGGAIAIDLATRVSDAAGLIVEGTFTSLPAVLATFKWGWRPVRALLTQRFDAAALVAEVKIPMLVIHGDADRLIAPALGRALYERALAPKRFLLVQGGSHHDADAVGQPQLREALRELFNLRV